MANKINWKVLVISLVVVYGIAFLGSLFTSPVTDSAWYDSIRPDITPPNYVFPIVWNILFFLIALSLYFAWMASKNKKDRKSVVLVFGINLLLNVLWSVLYFGLKRPDLAFFELIFLWVSIGVMVFATHKIKRLSSYLLLPYWVWVTFAGVLNYLSAF